MLPGSETYRYYTASLVFCLQWWSSHFLCHSINLLYVVGKVKHLVD